MHSRLKLIVPLGMLFFFGCIEIPEVEAPAPTPPEQQPPANNVPQPSFTLAAAPTQLSLLQGQRQSVQVSLTRMGGFSDSVQVSAVGLPAGVTVQPVTIAAGSTSGTLEVVVGQSAAPGTVTLTLRGTAGTLSREASVAVTVVQLGDLLVGWGSPTADKVYVNGALSMQVMVEGGAADYVEVLKGQTVLAKLTTSPYQYTWDTTQEAEQTYALTARAVRGTTNFTSPVRNVVVDRTAPTVVARTPEHGATNVSVKQALTVGFSEPLKTTTVKDASVVVTAGGTSVAKTLALATDGQSLTVTPTAPLPVQNSVDVRLGTATEPLTDLAGNAVASTAWTFTVPAWLPMGGAISALEGNTSAENVAMKVDKNGNPVIAWSEFDGAAKNIHVSRWTGTDWAVMGTAQNSLTGSTDALNPALALDASNQLFVMWDEGAGTYGDTRDLYGRMWNASAWVSLPGMPVPPTTNSYDGLTSPSVVLDGRGRLAVAASSHVTDAGSFVEGFWLNLARDGWESMTWPRPADSGQCGGIKLATDVSGQVLSVSHCLTNINTSAYWGLTVQRLESWGWSTFGSAIQASNSGGGAVLATDEAGNPLIAWEDLSADGTDRRIYASWWVGGSWISMGDVAGPHSTSNSAPSILVDGDNRALVAWSGFASPERSIWVSQWTGSNWQLVGAPLSALSGASTAAFQPVLALDKNGKPLVAWHESDGTTSHIFVYRFNY